MYLTLFFMLGLGSYMWLRLRLELYNKDHLEKAETWGHIGPSRLYGGELS